MPMVTPHVPDGLIDLMKTLTKNVLKEKPENIYQFAVEHFEKLITERDGSMDKGYERFRGEVKYFKAKGKYEQALKRNRLMKYKAKENSKLEESDGNDNNQTQQTLQRKFKARKLSSRKPSETLLAIKEEDGEEAAKNEIESELRKREAAAYQIQRVYRRFLGRRKSGVDGEQKSPMSKEVAALVIQTTLNAMVGKKANRNEDDSVAGDKSESITSPEGSSANNAESKNIFDTKEEQGKMDQIKSDNYLSLLDSSDEQHPSMAFGERCNELENLEDTSTVLSDFNGIPQIDDAVLADKNIIEKIKEDLKGQIMEEIVKPAIEAAKSPKKITGSLGTGEFPGKSESAILSSLSDAKYPNVTESNAEIADILHNPANLSKVSGENDDNKGSSSIDNLQKRHYNGKQVARVSSLQQTSKDEDGSPASEKTAEQASLVKVIRNEKAHRDENKNLKYQPDIQDSSNETSSKTVPSTNSNLKSSNDPSIEQSSLAKILKDEKDSITKTFAEEAESSLSSLETVIAANASKLSSLNDPNGFKSDSSPFTSLDSTVSQSKNDKNESSKTSEQVSTELESLSKILKAEMDKKEEESSEVLPKTGVSENDDAGLNQSEQSAQKAILTNEASGKEEKAEQSNVPNDTSREDTILPGKIVAVEDITEEVESLSRILHDEKDLIEGQNSLQLVPTPATENINMSAKVVIPSQEASSAESEVGKESDTKLVMDEKISMEIDVNEDLDNKERKESDFSDHKQPDEYQPSTDVIKNIRSKDAIKSDSERDLKGKPNVLETDSSVSNQSQEQKSESAAKDSKSVDNLTESIAITGDSIDEKLPVHSGDTKPQKDPVQNSNSESIPKLHNFDNKEASSIPEKDHESNLADKNKEAETTEGESKVRDKPSKDLHVSSDDREELEEVMEPECVKVVVQKPNEEQIGSSDEPSATIEVNVEHIDNQENDPIKKEVKQESSLKSSKEDDKIISKDTADRVLKDKEKGNLSKEEKGVPLHEEVENTSKTSNDAGLIGVDEARMPQIEQDSLVGSIRNFKRQNEADKNSVNTSRDTDNNGVSSSTNDMEMQKADSLLEESNKKGDLENQDQLTSEQKSVAQENDQNQQDKQMTTLEKRNDSTERSGSKIEIIEGHDEKLAEGKPDGLQLDTKDVSKFQINEATETPIGKNTELVDRKLNKSLDELDEKSDERDNSNDVPDVLSNFNSKVSKLADTKREMNKKKDEVIGKHSEVIVPEETKQQLSEKFDNEAIKVRDQLDKKIYYGRDGVAIVLDDEDKSGSVEEYVGSEEVGEVVASKVVSALTLALAKQVDEQTSQEGNLQEQMNEQTKLTENHETFENQNQPRIKRRLDAGSYSESNPTTINSLVEIFPTSAPPNDNGALAEKQPTTKVGNKVQNEDAKSYENAKSSIVTKVSDTLNKVINNFHPESSMKNERTKSVEENLQRRASTAKDASVEKLNMNDSAEIKQDEHADKEYKTEPSVNLQHSKLLKDEKAHLSQDVPLQKEVLLETIKIPEDHTSVGNSAIFEEQKTELEKSRNVPFDRDAEEPEMSFNDKLTTINNVMADGDERPMEVAHLAQKVVDPPEPNSLTNSQDDFNPKNEKLVETAAPEATKDGNFILKEDTQKDQNQVFAEYLEVDKSEDNSAEKAQTTNSFSILEQMKENTEASSNDLAKFTETAIEDGGIQRELSEKFNEKTKEETEGASKVSDSHTNTAGSFDEDTSEDHTNSHMNQQKLGDNSVEKADGTFDKKEERASNETKHASKKIDEPDHLQAGKFVENDVKKAVSNIKASKPVVLQEQVRRTPEPAIIFDSDCNSDNQQSERSNGSTDNHRGIQKREAFNEIGQPPSNVINESANNDIAEMNSQALNNAVLLDKNKYTTGTGEALLNNESVPSDINSKNRNNRGNNTQKEGDQNTNPIGMIERLQGMPPEKSEPKKVELTNDGRSNLEQPHEGIDHLSAEINDLVKSTETTYGDERKTEGIKVPTKIPNSSTKHASKKIGEQNHPRVEKIVENNVKVAVSSNGASKPAALQEDTRSSPEPALIIDSDSKNNDYLAYVNNESTIEQEKTFNKIDKYSSNVTNDSIDAQKTEENAADLVEMNNRIAKSTVSMEQAKHITEIGAALFSDKPVPIDLNSESRKDSGISTNDTEQREPKEVLLAEINGPVKSSETANRNDGIQEKLSEKSNERSKQEVGKPSSNVTKTPEKKNCLDVPKAEEIAADVAEMNNKAANSRKHATKTDEAFLCNKDIASENREQSGKSTKNIERGEDGNRDELQKGARVQGSLQEQANVNKEQSINDGDTNSRKQQEEFDDLSVNTIEDHENLDAYNTEVTPVEDLKTIKTENSSDIVSNTTDKRSNEKSLDGDLTKAENNLFLTQNKDFPKKDELIPEDGNRSKGKISAISKDLSIVPLQQKETDKGQESMINQNHHIESDIVKPEKLDDLTANPTKNLELSELESQVLEDGTIDEPNKGKISEQEAGKLKNLHERNFDSAVHKKGPLDSISDGFKALFSEANEEVMKKLNSAANTIQTAFRNYITRKSSKPEPNSKHPISESEDYDASPLEDPKRSITIVEPSNELIINDSDSKRVWYVGNEPIIPTTPRKTDDYSLDSLELDSISFVPLQESVTKNDDFSARNESLFEEFPDSLDNSELDSERTTESWPKMKKNKASSMDLTKVVDNFDDTLGLKIELPNLETESISDSAIIELESSPKLIADSSPNFDAIESRQNFDQSTVDVVNCSIDEKPLSSKTVDVDLTATKIINEETGELEEMEINQTENQRHEQIKGLENGYTENVTATKTESGKEEVLGASNRSKKSVKHFEVGEPDKSSDKVDEAHTKFEHGSNLITPLSNQLDDSGISSSNPSDIEHSTKDLKKLAATNQQTAIIGNAIPIPDIAAAAVVIQSAYRSFRTRRDLQHQPTLPFQSMNEILNSTSETSAEPSSNDESGVEMPHQTNHEDSSDIENVDITVYGEDSLEAMYYSLKKHEVLLDKMHQQASVCKSASKERNGMLASEPQLEDSEESMKDASDLKASKADLFDRTTDDVKSMDEIQNDTEADDEIPQSERKLSRNESYYTACMTRPITSADLTPKKEYLPRYDIEDPIEISQKQTERFLQGNHEAVDSVTESLDEAMNEIKNDFEADDKIPPSERKLSRNESYYTACMTRPITSAELTPKKEYPPRYNIEDPIEISQKRTNRFLQGIHGTVDSVTESLDEATTDGIRRNILAYSVSEADSDYCETAEEKTGVALNDFNISTAFEGITSTDTDSTIISAVTKIQAGARGFLTRRRLRRASLGTVSLSTERKASFGNDAIDESLDDMLDEQDAALKIQKSFRRYRNRKTRLSAPALQKYITEDAATGTVPATVASSSKSKDDSSEDQQQRVLGITEVKLEQKPTNSANMSRNGLSSRRSGSITFLAGNKHDANKSSVDISDAPNGHQYEENNSEDKRHDVGISFDGLNLAARRMTLQRGDAVQRNSTAEEDSNGESITTSGSTGGQLYDASKNADNENKPRSGSAKTIDSERRRRVNHEHFIRFGLRQRTMPVQIDFEILRALPKHLRKRVRSADQQNKRKMDF